MFKIATSKIGKHDTKLTCAFRPSQMFREAAKRTDQHFDIHVSYMQIYNDVPYDLLQDIPGRQVRRAAQHDHSITPVLMLHTPGHSPCSDLAACTAFVPYPFA